jgi:hypothetical protein
MTFQFSWRTIGRGPPRWQGEERAERRELPTLPLTRESGTVPPPRMPHSSPDDATPTSHGARDRREWSREVEFESFGVRVQIRATRADVVDEVVRRLPVQVPGGSSKVANALFSVIDDGRTPGAEIRLGDEVVASATGYGELCAMLESQVSQFVAEHAPAHVFLHAGCVTWSGRAILVPGRSFSGKTTLVAAFLRAGATYYSDEYAVLDEHGLVHPFPRLLSVRRTGNTLPDKVAPDHFEAPVGSAPAEVACVVHTSFAGLPAWRPRRLSPGRITLALLDNAVPAREKPAATLRAIQRIAERAIGLAGPRGDADAVVARVIRALGKA